MTKEITYVVTDIEADGPVPGIYSMLGFGSVACDKNGEQIAEFEVNLSPLPGAKQHPATMKWWGTEPEAWEYVTQNQEDPAIAVPRFYDWISTLPGKTVIAAHPGSFDWMFMVWYLAKFVEKFETEQPMYTLGAGFDIKSYAAATLGQGFFDTGRHTYPDEWLGNIVHSHKAIDDARGYAVLLATMLKKNRQLHS